MTDRELLEAAAKVAGIAWTRYDAAPDVANPMRASGWGLVVSAASCSLDGLYVIHWNPLTEDGDALRLAVKLGLTIKVDTRAGFSWIKGFEGSPAHGTDPYAATRKAIVRAAASLAGRG